MARRRFEFPVQNPLLDISLSFSWCPGGLHPTEPWCVSLIHDLKVKEEATTQLSQRKREHKAAANEKHEHPAETEAGIQNRQEKRTENKRLDHMIHPFMQSTVVTDLISI